MSDFSLYSINWQDGMLITQQHLKNQEKYFDNLVRWHILQAGDNYGLVRRSHGGKAALSLNLAVSGNRLRVEVVRCQALTPDGHYIEINDTEGEVFRGEAEISEVVVPVYIGVDTSRKKPVGDPDPVEDLPRVPYMMNNYVVFVGQRPNIPEGRYIQVAELNINGSDVSYSPHYYPPCLTVYAEERLAEHVTELRNRLENLLKLSIRAFKAISASGSLQGESTHLQDAVRETVYLLVNHLSAVIDEFVIGPNSGHPLSMVIIFKKVFRVYSTLINLHPVLKDYLNEKLFTPELSSDVDQFLSSMDNFLTTEYDHQDLGTQLRMIDDIVNNLRNIMSFMAQTKREDLGEQAVATETMTYSGRTYRNVGFSGSHLEQVGELSYLQINISEPLPMQDNVVLISKGLFSDIEWRNMQVRLGLNDARGLGETDPVDVDTVAFSNKVALHPRDMLKSSSVRQVTLIFRGAGDSTKFENLGKMDLLIYAL